MLISALNQYYDVLISNNKLTEPGYEDCDVSYIVVLSPEGKMTGILDSREKEEVDVRGKTKIVYKPKTVRIPERPRSTTVSANYVEVRPGYIFGLEYRSGKDEGTLSIFCSSAKTEKQKERLKLQHHSFCEEVEKDFGAMTSPLAKAYLQFARKWRPELEVNNPFLLGLKKDLNKCKFAFCLDGHPETLLQNDIEVREVWQSLREKAEAASKNGITCQCAVTGKEQPVAEVHDTLISGSEIGIRNTGINPSLVNFKPESFLSYNHKQGENACISVETMKRYTKALNYLLSSTSNHSYLDGQTIVYWSDDGNTENDRLMNLVMKQQSDRYGEGELDAALSGIMEEALKGTVTNCKIEDIKLRLSPEAEYYFVGFAPNASRIQVKFLYRQNFGKVLYNIARFQHDMQILNKRKPVPLWKLKREMVAPASSHPETNDTPFDSIFNAILKGTDYPVWCLSRMITRVKKDADKEDNSFIRLNSIRTGFIKACLIRHTKEEVSMGYDSNNDNPAYICGALFAILQKIQEDAASPIKLNRTIKDAYFSSAISNPAAVMPKLIKLSTYHLKKLYRDKKRQSWAINDDKTLSETMQKLGTQFPGTLGLYDQGRFILGYYQRYAEFFKKIMSERPYSKEDCNDSEQV